MASSAKCPRWVGRPIVPALIAGRDRVTCPLVGVPVTIGVPVFNGDNYLERALSSIQQQTYENITVLISDNASTDGTEEIGRAFASEDSRFVYSRNEQNIGAVPNYNKVFHAAQTPLFKWAAHDDWIEPRFIEACVEGLDNDPGAILAFSGARQVDENDQETTPLLAYTEITSEDPVERFKEVVLRERLNLAIFGVIRRDVLARTHLQGTYHASSRVLVAELAILGRFVRVPEVLFVHRNHPSGSLRSYGNAHELRQWYDTSRSAKGYMPRWAYMGGILKVAEIGDLTFGQKMAVRGEALRYGITKPKNLLGDLVVAGRNLVSSKS
jgi:glycosyltransferase involved in cell wall biosynthesis